MCLSCPFQPGSREGSRAGLPEPLPVQQYCSREPVFIISVGHRASCPFETVRRPWLDLRPEGLVRHCGFPARSRRPVHCPWFDLLAGDPARPPRLDPALACAFVAFAPGDRCPSYFGPGSGPGFVLAPGTRLHHLRTTSPEHAVRHSLAGTTRQERPPNTWILISFCIPSLVCACVAIIPSTPQGCRTGVSS